MCEQTWEEHYDDGTLRIVVPQDRTGKKNDGPGKVHGHHRRSCKITMTRVIREKTVGIIDKNRFVQGRCYVKLLEDL